MRKSIPIGQVLLKNGCITQEQLDRALEVQQKSKGKRLGDILIELSYVSEHKVLECLSESVNVPFIDIRNYAIDERAVATITGSYAKKNLVLPIDFQNGMLLVAVNDPLAFYIMDEIHAMTDYEVSVVLAIKKDLSYMIDRCYSESAVSRAVEDINRTYHQAEETTNLLMDDRIDGAPVVKMVNTLIAQAYQKGASDVHIEPSEKNLVVRIRINGDLVHHSTMNMAAHNSVVTRLKLQGGMNIAEKRIPQDGKFHFSYGNIQVDVRVSSLPTIFGEKVVLRLLAAGNSANLLDLRKIGMTPVQLTQYENMLKSPNGIVLVTGPTGSGKTTTLYATLSKLAQRKANIITVEDPVERHIVGVNQVQTNDKAGLTFVSALRSILRQDPDVIMVGEMRDSETASIGVRAAITGHLVLSTIHTNDAIASIARLEDMGIAPYMVAASITGVIAQRLVKVLCPHCKKHHELTDAEKPLMRGMDTTQICEPSGCERCNFTGYSGRAPVYEMLQVDGALREMITNGATVHEMKEQKRKEGMEFLRDAVTKMVLDGSTSIAEMEKIIYSVD